MTDKLSRNNPCHTAGIKCYFNNNNKIIHLTSSETKNESKSNSSLHFFRRFATVISGRHRGYISVCFPVFLRSRLQRVHFRVCIGLFRRNFRLCGFVFRHIVYIKPKDPNNPDDSTFIPQRLQENAKKVPESSSVTVVGWGSSCIPNAGFSELASPLAVRSSRIFWWSKMSSQNCSHLSKSQSINQSIDRPSEQDRIGQSINQSINCKIPYVNHHKKLE